MIFLIVFGILTLGRFLLIQKCFLEDPDEYSFLFLIVHYSELMTLNIETWTNTMFHAYSSMPETFIRLIQVNCLKLYAAVMELPITSTKALRLIGVFNSLVSIFNLAIFYKILSKLGLEKLFAIIAVLLLGTFINTNIYVRHIFPYETGLMFQLLALLVLLNAKADNKTLLKAGLLSALGFTNYFGYFMFVFILLGFILVKENSQAIKLKLKAIILFLLPFFLIVASFEVLSQVAGDSYIMHTFLFAETIVQGSPSEGLVMVFKYFYEVEGWWGLLVLSLFFVSVVLSIAKKQKNEMDKLLLLGSAAYCVFGIYVVLSGSMVFYGRVLHMYYPFIVLGAIGQIVKIKWSVWVLVPLCLLNYWGNIDELNKLDYPRSMINEYGLYESEQLRLSYINELDCAIDYASNEDTHLVETGTVWQTEQHLRLLNFCFFKHYPDDFMSSYHSTELKDEENVLVKKKHFMSHPAYLFEYCTNEGRDFYMDIDLHLMILKNE